jgi:hypothetical protein
VSSPSDPQPPVDPPARLQPTTREIPVAQPTAGATAAPPQAPPPQAPQPHQLPPHPGAITPTQVQATAASADAPQPTGPVDFVPGPPRPAAPPLPPPVGAAHVAAPPASAPVWPETLTSMAPAPERPTKKRRLRALRDRTALVGSGLVALSLVLLELGLALDFGDESYWSVVPLWSAFATACVLLGVLALASFYPAGNRLRSGPTWRVAAGGLVGLSAFWLLVVLPAVDTDRGFVLTAALAALGGALWIGPRRKD